MSSKLTWNEFVENVQQWAKERGIYEHSTPQAQLMKTLSEGGELADALIKGDRDGMLDGVGDSVVCLVNYATMIGDTAFLGDFESIEEFQEVIDTPHECLGYFFNEVSNLVTDYVDGSYEKAIACLIEFCNLMSLSFPDCCTQAWESIKDRKGRMVAGGAFVKDEE